MRLICGFDPPWLVLRRGVAMRAVAAAHPGLHLRLTLPGLVTGDRVGPHAEMEGCIRQASGRLSAVTGRRPSEAFSAMIRRPGVRGRSGPPCLVLAAARAPGLRAPSADGADLNDPATYPPLIVRAGRSMEGPEGLDDPDEAEALFAAERWSASRASLRSRWSAADMSPRCRRNTIRRGRKRWWTRSCAVRCGMKTRSACQWSMAGTSPVRGTLSRADAQAPEG